MLALLKAHHILHVSRISVTILYLVHTMIYVFCMIHKVMNIMRMVFVMENQRVFYEVGTSFEH